MYRWSKFGKVGASCWIRDGTQSSQMVGHDLGITNLGELNEGPKLTNNEAIIIEARKRDETFKSWIILFCHPTNTNCW